MVKNGGGCPLAFRRQQMKENQPTSIVKEMEQHLIAKFSFEGRSNNDADRDIIVDQSGKGATMTLNFSGSWGAGDEYTLTGYYDDALCVAERGAYATIQLPVAISDDYTIICHRGYYGDSGFKSCQYSSLLGSRATDSASVSPIYMEYYDVAAPLLTQSFGRRMNRVESPVAWLTPTHYNNRELGEKSSTTSDGKVVDTLYIGRIRANVTPVNKPRAKVFSIHIFDQSFSAEDIAAYITARVLPSYQLP